MTKNGKRRSITTSASDYRLTVPTFVLKDNATEHRFSRTCLVVASVPMGIESRRETALRGFENGNKSQRSTKRAGTTGQRDNSTAEWRLNGITPSVANIGFNGGGISPRIPEGLRLGERLIPSHHYIS
jgi:hypothetical protein